MECQKTTLTQLNNNSAYQTGLYLRLSKDDLVKGESISIETQRLILTRFCQENGLNIVDEYVDDGFSGANFNRPEFQRMIEDVEKGKINCVLTKDLSRLGRDYIQTGTYIELYFTDKNVRYVAVDDGVDTNNTDSVSDIMMPIRNLFNEWYVRDISKKVRNAKRRRMAEGMYISSQTAYGYKVNPENKAQLVIDEEAAEVVRTIFSLALEGKGVVHIARELTKRRILIPSAYKYLKGDTRFARYINDKPESYKYTWCTPTVQAILHDMVYMGDMENLKQEKISYKSKKYRSVPKSQRFIVRDTHAPIVSRENYYTVQELMTSRHRPAKYHDENIFKSIIFCKNCGGRLSIQGKQLKTGRVVWYRCQKYYHYPDKCYSGNFINYEALVQIVTKELKEKIAVFKENNSIPEMLVKRINDTGRQNRLHKDQRTAENRLLTLKSLIRRLYEDFNSQLLTLSNYQDLLNDYQQEQKQLEERVSEIKLSLDENNNELNRFMMFQEALQKFVNFEKLDAVMVNNLIERIEVGHKVEVDGKVVQPIDIVYRFVGKI